MKATLKLEDGWGITVDVPEELLKHIEKPVKKTGYERVKEDCSFYAINGYGVVERLFDKGSELEDSLFNNANYYTDDRFALDIARADLLKRSLRRVSVENREDRIDWQSVGQDKYCIFYDYDTRTFDIVEETWCRAFGAVYFDSYGAASAALEEFKDELIWYFTEYKDCL